MADEKWIIQVKEELNYLTETRSIESKRWENQSIYRIPESMKEVRRSAYQPQMVSIGPYHHGEQQLEAMVKHKQRALLNFLERSRKPLECYVDALAQVVEDLKGAYNQLEPQWKEDRGEAFLKVMMVDGCFILELMRSTTATPEVLSQMGYARKDPVFSYHGKLCLIPLLKRDMLMLENQLPLVVLGLLLAVEDGVLDIDGFSKQDHLTKLILKFFYRPHGTGNIQELRNCGHILDLYRKSLLFGHLWWKRRKRRARLWDDYPNHGHEMKPYDCISSATELRDAGIRFEQSLTRNLNDISFSRGVLKLPLVIVDDTFESEYLNLVAFERFHFDAGYYVTSYICFMQFIVDSARDVSLLRSRSIILNALGSDKAVAQLFSNLHRDIDDDPDNSIAIVYREVAQYCQSPLPRWMAYARYNYFSNPWLALSIVAAILLFALAAFQTVYTILAYYHDPNK